MSRRNQLAQATRFWVSIIIAVLLISPYVKDRVESGLASAKPANSVPVYSDDFSMNTNMDIFLNLQDDVWSNLDLTEKLQVCHAILNMEGHLLSFSDVIELSAYDLPTGTLGSYDYVHKTIYLDTDYICNASGREVTETILHEAYHVIQYQGKEIYDSLDPVYQNSYLLMDLSTYSRELDNYVDGKKEGEYQEYYSQRIESDARAYAKENTKLIFDYINNYIENNNQGGDTYE